VAFRRSEWALIAYFLYITVLARILPVKNGIPNFILAVNLAVIAGLAVLAYVDVGAIRDWLPTPLLLLLCYREMGWLAPARHTYQLERIWVVWDKYFLNTMGAKALIESLGPVIPSLLDISYTLVYTTPYFAIGVLYAYRRSDRVDRFLFPLVLSVVCAYALFPYIPSEPPRTVFPGQDFPAYVTFFRRFNWRMLENYGIHTGVFPSAHVSAAFTAAFFMRKVLPERKWPWRFLLVLAVMIATASVYGRYHYLADAAAGLTLSLAVAGVSSWLGPAWNRRRAWSRPPASVTRS
jgi:membrane-associated phospholipid phosphatase